MTEPNANTRRTARRIAMSILYSREFNKNSVEEAIGVMSQMRDDWATIPDFTRQLCILVQQHELEIDGQIRDVLQNWVMSRVALVDKAILKLGCAEILYFSEIPPRVTLNEYIELGKMFGNENSATFINGILDKLMHKHNKADFQAGNQAREPKSPL